jgi:hypothetical protein
VTGRQFCVGRNRISLLSWQVTEIAQKDPMDAPWTVDEVDEQMRASMAQWPKLMNAMEV